MLIILAPIIMETPAAIEKNAVAEGMSRMMGREVKGHITTQARPCDMLVAFCNNTLAGSKKAPLQPKGRLQIFH